MIPQKTVQNWKETNAPWRSLGQVEQDLIIERALVCIYNEPSLQKDLIFRGGTALNKLFIQPPSRYSEDIDLVKLSAGPIGETFDLLQTVLNPWLGKPKRVLKERAAKLYYRYQCVENKSRKLKIEINTVENRHVCPLLSMPFSVKSEWFIGHANITTYQLEELLATKLRAVYQRRKGRDLFDIWYVGKNLQVDWQKLFDLYAEYGAFVKEPISKTLFLESLEEKKQNLDYQTDIIAILPHDFDYDFNRAFDFVYHDIVMKMPQ